jgi:hypothetical protein
MGPSNANRNGGCSLHLSGAGYPLASKNGNRQIVFFPPILGIVGTYIVLYPYIMGLSCFIFPCWTEGCLKKQLHPLYFDETLQAVKSYGCSLHTLHLRQLWSPTGMAKFWALEHQSHWTWITASQASMRQSTHWQLRQSKHIIMSYQYKYPYIIYHISSYIYHPNIYVCVYIYLCARERERDLFGKSTQNSSTAVHHSSPCLPRQGQTAHAHCGAWIGRHQRPCN